MPRGYPPNLLVYTSTRNPGSVTRGFGTVTYCGQGRGDISSPFLKNRFANSKESVETRLLGREIDTPRTFVTSL
jgi:hypothetical protein